MQYKIHQSVILFLFIFNYISIKAQVFGGDFYINYNTAMLNISAYGIDNEKFENNAKKLFTKKR